VSGTRPVSIRARNESASGGDEPIHLRDLRTWAYTKSIMNREEIIGVLRQHAADLAREGVRSLALFGSVARGTASAGSDIDLLVEFERPVGLFAFVGLQQRLTELLGRPVDLVPRDGLKPRLRAAILSEAIPVA